MGVQTVLGLIQDPALRTVYDLRCYLLASTGWQTMEEDMFGEKELHHFHLKIDKIQT